MYMYVSEVFAESARAYRLERKISDLHNSVNAISETIGLDDSFRRSNGYLIRRVGDYRLVAKIVRVDGYNVLCLLGVLRRGNKEYEVFLNAAEQGRGTSLDDALDEANVREWLNGELERGNGVEVVPPLPGELYPWLEPPGWGLGTEDRIVYESEDWVERIRSREVLKHLDSYQRMLLRIIEGDPDIAQETRWPGVKRATCDDLYVLYSEFEVTDTENSPPHRALLLIAPFSDEFLDREVDEIVIRSHPIYSSAPESAARFAGQITVDDLGPFARRSYPDYILYDRKAWSDIEDDVEANLALSPEEQGILRQVSLQAPSGTRLPLFINGRAGSGKSTMLFYLFADYCHRKHRQELDGDPLFITYSDRLITRAKESVGRVLRSHHRFLAERGEHEEPPSIDAYFQPFQKLLLGMLPPEEQERFDEDKYISFPRFKRLYTGHPMCWAPDDGEDDERRHAKQELDLVCNLPQATQLSPELCWHVVRTLIKGYRSDMFLGTQDYPEIPRKELSVSEAVFKLIHTSIWEKWYMPITVNEGYWDDQDLVRRVLELGCHRSDYAAVFCDEAQDFTRLELQLILRLLMLCKYDLGYQPIYSLPFAFGGDPLQTVNPTGFRWPALKSAFYDEVITALDPARDRGLDMSFHELAYNYRSVQSIVRLGNVILLWRHVLYDLPELKPQQSWWKGELPKPVRFIVERNITLQQLKDILQDTMIIVPVEPGMENSYIKEDPVLSKVIPEPSEEPPRNVISVVSAKGLEFERVVLYGFGEACDNSVWSAGCDNTAEPSVDAEYFFNKLYVAATRAVKHLFVVDSEEGEERLWRYASSDQQLREFLMRADAPEVWEPHIEPIGMGRDEDMPGMEEIDPVNTADELKRVGLQARDPSLLRRAAAFYQRHGKRRAADECEAWALKFEGRPRRAGNLFIDIGMVDEAWDCFWLGMCWPEAHQWLEAHPGRRPAEVSALVRFMLQGADDLNGIKAFAAVLQGCMEQGLLGSPLSSQWRAAAGEYVARLSDVAEGDLSRGEWRESGEVLEGLARVGLGRAALDPAAACYHRAWEWQAAVRCWESAGTIDKQEYLIAKSRVAGLPDGLQYLERAGRHDLIIEEWEAAGSLDTAAGPKWLRHVGPALEDKGQYYKAFNVYRRLGNTEREWACFERASALISQDELWQALESLVTDLRRRGLEPDAIDAMNTYFPSVIGRDTLKVRLQAHLVSDLAYSDRMPENFAGHRRRYTGLIRDMLLMEGWRNHVSVKEVGSALERIGDFLASRAFYNRFTGDPEPELRRSARERWIAVMRKHEDWYRMRGDEKKRVETSQKLGRQAGEWGLRRNMPLPLYPDLDADVLALVPTGTQIEELNTGDLRFPVGNIEVTIVRSKRLVEITDHRSWQRLQVDFEKREVRPSGEQKIRQEREGDEVDFSAPASGYGGRAVFAGRSRLELWKEGLQGTIVIRMKTAAPNTGERYDTDARKP